MPHTIQCDHCGVVLNLPDHAGGKRLKCPKCGHKFLVDADTGNYPTQERSDHDASPASSALLPQGRGDDAMPTAAGDLRETFDLPLMTEASSTPATAARAQAADALALFEEKKPAPRRPSSAEARAKSRRCPTCGGVVPVGMSICASCGLDLESGSRVQLDDDLMPEAPVRHVSAPLPLTIIAISSLLGSAALGLYAASQWYRGVAGCQYFVLICIFGAYSAVHLLRGHSPKLLLVALTLGAVIDIVALIALPIVQANQDTRVVQGPADEEGNTTFIEPITDRLDQQQLSLGIAVLLMYAAICVYLMSPTVRRHYGR